MLDCWSIYVLIALGIMVSVFLFCKVKFKDGRNIPVVSGSFPFFGHVFEMLEGSPWDVLTRWVMQYGMIYKFHLFGSDCVCVSDPALLRVILQTNYLNYKKDLKWTYKPFMALLGSGLVSAEGQNHRRQRTLLSHPLRIEILEEIPYMTLKAISRLSHRLNNAVNESTTVEMAEEFRHLTLQVIAEAILSLSPEESDQTFAKMYLPIVEEGNKRTWNPTRMYIPSSSWFKHNRDIATLNNYMQSLIVQRWEHRKCERKEGNNSKNRRKDILDRTLDAIPYDQWDEAMICQVRDEMKTFILAGHETSASMLTWTLYELSMNKAVKDKAVAEAEILLAKYIENGKFDPKLVFECLTNAMPYFEYSECCLKESLRKYSVVPTVVRVSAESTKLGDYYLSKGSKIMVNMQGVHHNPIFWPEPDLFRPERFLSKIQPYTFLPFIEGPRMCLGQFLSLLESKIVLATLLCMYDFQTVNKDAGLKHPYMVPIIPKSGHHMRVYHRGKK